MWKKIRTGTHIEKNKNWNTCGSSSIFYEVYIVN